MEASFPEGGSFFGVRKEDQNQMQQQQHSPTTPSSLATPPPPPPQKKRRNQPGTPNPDAEIIALSPKTLMTTNRFTCEVCNKGFQREQNLQLHRRGHNLPWKLKQKNTKEPKKIKVYLCPEPTCAHHDPSRALGDLTGIKKHYFRKHGEKKWRCERCSKKYAVQSDLKAHSKICGTKEYRCDCGTLFSRRDSFITHRAFCDALTQESATQPLPLPPPPSDLSHGVINNGTQLYGTASINMSLAMAPIIHDHQSSDHNTTLSHQTMHPPTFFMPDPTQPENYHNDPTPVSNNNLFNNNHPFFSAGGNNNLYFSEPNFFSSNWCHHQTVPHMSATALLQKAAQMGATSSTNNNNAAPTAASLLRSYENSAASASLSSKSIQEMMNTSVFETGFDEKVSVGGSDRLTRDFLGVGHEIVRSMSGGVSVSEKEEEHGGFGISPLEEVRNAAQTGEPFGDGGSFQ